MSRRVDGGSVGTDESGASEVLAFLLVTSIVIVGVAGILLVAGPTLVGEQDRVEVGQAEQALTQFDAEAFRVATGSTSSSRVDLGLRGNSGTLDVEPESGHIRIEYRDDLFGTNRTEVLNTSLGTVVYEEDDTTIGYQGGGVWRSDGSRSVLISPPEISYDGRTLTMPIVTTERAGSVHSDVQIRPNGLSEQKFPDPSASSLQNKVNTGTLRITIESRYYLAWGQFFEDRTDAVVAYPGGQRVVVIFFGSAFSISEDAGIISTSGPGEVYISGTSGPQDEPTAYVDSYDSSVGPYSDTENETGVLKAAGDVTLTGNSAIQGDTESEGRIDLKGDNSNITRDADAIEGVYVKNEEVEPGQADNYDQIGGNVTNEASVPNLVPLPVKDRVDDIRNNNNNDDEDGIVSNQIEFNASGAQEIGPGTYYLEEIDMDDKNLFLDARNGSITLAVNNYVSLEGDSKIQVKGQPDDSVVQVYIAARGSSGNTVPVGSGSTEGRADHFYVGKGDKITVKGDRSPRFQVIGPADFTGGVRGNSNKNATEMTGVVFAPTLAPTNESEFTIRDAEFFGAVVTGNLSIDNKAEVHFDRGIIDVGVPVPEGALLDFLYATEHRIEVDSG